MTTASSAPADGTGASPTILALVRSLNAEILASRSATLSLETWCRDHHPGEAPLIIARLDRSLHKPASPEQRRRLQVSEHEPVTYRHVRLFCGTRVLSEADNWYVPSRLSPEMNHVLETTDTPFGKAVQALNPYRQTFAARVLWSPRSPEIPDSLFEHRALLRTPDHLPLSEVDEVYKRALLDFAAPATGP